VTRGILIVDDSALMRKILKKSLVMCGIDVTRVHEAGTGREALSVFASTPIDVAFVDLNMPEMDGMELIQRLTEGGTSPKPAIVVVSSDRSQAKIDRLKALGAHYLGKPFKPEEILVVVERVLLRRGATHD
jgi:two-component system chemotaxis response regulator CheY